jgi:hypothetical protein
MRLGAASTVPDAAQWLPGEAVFAAARFNW